MQMDLKMLFKLQHYSLPQSLYKINLEEMLEDLLQKYLRMHQVIFF